MLLCVSFLLQTTHALYFKPESPLSDPFYEIPEDVEKYAEGEIISYRKAPLMIRAVYYPINVKNAWQFLVRSNDGNNKPTAVVTTILEPFDADPSKLLSYHFAEDSASPECSPSYSLLFGAPMSSIVIQVEAYIMNPALAKGWYVVAPDYEGSLAAFTVGKQAGRAALDSIRAALASGNVTGINEDASVAMWGYSGGTIPTGWGAQLQPEYAPELKDNLVGAAMGGWCTNVTATVEATDGTVFAGLIPNGINGILTHYPEVYKNIHKEFSLEERFERFNQSRSKCLAGSIVSYLLDDFFGGDDPYFSAGWDFFRQEEIVKIIDDNTLALSEEDGLPEIPLFVFHGMQDEIIPIVGSERAYDNYCEWGIDSMEFATSNTTGHILELVEGSGAALTWLEDRLNGVDAVKGCKRTYRDTNLAYPGADLTYYKLFKTAISAYKGEELGPELQANLTMSLTGDLTLDVIQWAVEKIGPVPLKRDLEARDLDTRDIAEILMASEGLL